MKKIIIINGPNLNLLGKREPEIYGSESFEAYFKSLKEEFPNLELYYYQSNIEGELIDKLHEVGFSYDGIILNAAAYTHTSVALCDALSLFSGPKIEVHVSNVMKREQFRHKSFISAVCDGIIVGLGVNSYLLAVRAANDLLDQS